jgi:hypothetical protein
MTGCGNPDRALAAPADWVRECPSDAFCFNRPANLVLKPAQAIDSLAAEYHSDGLILRYDMGRYASSVRHLVKPTEEAMTVNGRPARLLVSEREIVLVVPKVRDGGAVNVQFTMALVFKSAASRELAQQVFSSIEFKAR